MILRNKSARNSCRRKLALGKKLSRKEATPESLITSTNSNTKAGTRGPKRPIPPNQVRITDLHRPHTGEPRVILKPSRVKKAVLLVEFQIKER